MTAQETTPRPRGRGRPPIGRRVHVNLPDDVVAYLDDWCGESGKSRAEIIRAALVEYIARRRAAS